MDTQVTNESTGMKIVITDVSVFFDLFHLQVLPEFFALELEIHTTDFVYNEIIHSVQKSEFAIFERSKKLHIIKITPEEEDDIRAMKLIRTNKSFPDRTVLWKAKQFNCALLTCDRTLRKEAEGHGLEVRGSIWVINELISNGIISKTKGIELLKHMKLVNPRLPVEEIDKLIKRLK
jgi:predicted nucleic acid-binding protein